jgi:hypothetical protein
VNELLAPVLFFHGLGHLVGFVGPWRLMDVEGVTFQSSLFDGRVQVGQRTMRTLGVGWLLLGCGFFVSAVAATQSAAWWIDWATGLALASLALCAVQWPAARIGGLVNLALLVILQLMRTSVWL